MNATLTSTLISNRAGAALATFSTQACRKALVTGLILGALTAPLAATPTEVVRDDAPVVDDESESPPGWELGFSAGLDFCTKQLTYGLIDNPHAILVPSGAFSIGHEDYFTVEVGVEAIYDTTNFGAKEGGYGDRRYKYQELAPGITLSRAWQTADWLGSTLETSINYTYEYHPASCKKPAAEYANPNTQWLNFEVTAPDFWLQPTLAVEYQLARQGAAGAEDGKGGLYATFSVAHEFEVGAAFGLEEGVLTLTPTLGVGLANKERNLCDFGSDSSLMFRDGFGVLELTYAPTERLSITPYVGFHQQLAGEAKDMTGDDDLVLYGGIALGYAF